jgi:hypothetical protein
MALINVDISNNRLYKLRFKRFERINLLSKRVIYMTNFSWIVFGVVLSMFLVSSCSSTLSSVSAVKAGYENEKDGWISRNIPSLEKLSNMIPPPTEARMKWDETQKKQKEGNRTEDGY